MTILPTMEDVASRGLKYDQEIDRLLGDVWRDFKALEPEIAALLESTFGAAELAALVIIGRVNNQPSFLEEFAEKNISKDNFINYLQKRLNISIQPTKQRLESESNEKTDNTQGKLSQLANHARKNYENELLRVFEKLKKKELETASIVLEFLGDEMQAAEFMVTPAPGLGNKSPLQTIEDGKKQEVLDLIGRLENNISS